MENNEAVRQLGLEIFMEEQKEIPAKMWRIISIHDRDSSECQEK